MLVVLAVSTSLVLWTAAAWRARRLRPARVDDLPLVAAADLRAGRHRLVGRVVPISTTASPIDGAECVFIEHAEYRTVGATAMPVLRQVGHGMLGHPFLVDDGTGCVLVDARHAEIEAVTVREDGGLAAERRIRAGEEVVVLAHFEKRPVESDGGPYRSGSMAWVACADEEGAPRVSYRTEPDMVTPVDDLTLFMRGASGLMLAATAILAAIRYLA